ncbi:ataxin-10 [Venturia canescens]|uniref:ataxin-10 n=1 Tax=Venturia canescens TaxID=32260 RepID=UPI001C9C16DB|nr:ataxin-10 [Venturia canescens]
MIKYDKLCSAIAENNWSFLIENIKPKDFARDDEGNLINKNILAKLAETLTSPDLNIPNNVKIVILKCFGNACLAGYVYEEFSQDIKDDKLLHDCCHKLYALLIDSPKTTSESFPYDGIIQWTVNYILTHFDVPEDSKDCLEMLRLSVQFLCNLLFVSENKNLPAPLITDDFKSAIIFLAAPKQIPICRAACTFLHNALKTSSESYYKGLQVHRMVETLIAADKLEVHVAGQSLLVLLKRLHWLESVYEDLSIESKLYLLAIIHQDVSETVYSESDSGKSTNFPNDLVEFLSKRFKRRSDLILKTVDSYLDGTEPEEISLLLDIIGVISCKDSQECCILQNDKSLVINCIFLLKSIHMAGKESNNHFTPLQKLNDVAPCNWEMNSGQETIQNHPAFGFKAALIRAIGNLVHKHKGNQKLLRETDAIPLLLDCCNIDARNPLIMQWAIFALRNVCEQSPENQEVIRNCNRIGIIDNEMIKEMGIKLQETEDGKGIGIIPLPRNE